MTFIISIKSKYARLIINKEKTIEIRRKFPLVNVANQKMYIYSSRIDKKIIGHVTIDRVEYIDKYIAWKKYYNQVGVSKEDYYNYLKDKKKAYFIHLKKIYKFKEHRALKHYGILRAPASFKRLEI